MACRNTDIILMKNKLEKYIYIELFFNSCLDGYKLNKYNTSI